MVALQQTSFYSTDLVSSPKWSELLGQLAPELKELVGEQGLLRLWGIFVRGRPGRQHTAVPAKPANISWVPTALSLLVNRRLRRRLHNGSAERGVPWTSVEVRRGLAASFKRLLTNPDLNQDGNLSNYVACNFLHEFRMPRDSALAAARPQATSPSSSPPRAKRDGSGKGSGVSKTARWNKDAPVPTANLFDALSSLEDTESRSDESLELVSEDSSAVSAEDEGCHGFYMQGIDTPPNLADMLARLQHCLSGIASLEVASDIAQHVDVLLSHFMELRAQVDKPSASASQMEEGNGVARTIYAKIQGLLGLLFDNETSAPVFASVIEAMLNVYQYIESAYPSGGYLDGLTMCYFHRQVDMAYSLKDVCPAGQGGTLFVQTIGVLSCAILLLSALTSSMCSKPGGPACADTKYLALLANSVADSLCMA